VTRVAVTGAIAAGKSTVLHWFAEWGAHSLSLDEIARTLSAPQGALWQAIVAEFGQGYLLPNGELNRRKLGQAVFADGTLRRRLNRISHPLILQEMERRVEAIRQRQPGAIVAIEVPLLVECALYPHFDRTVVVEAEEETRRARLLASGLSAEEVERRLGAQLSARVKRIFADWVVWNQGTLEQARAHTWQVWQELREEVAKYPVSVV